MRFKTYSAKLYAIKKDTRKDGTVHLGILVTINRKVKTLPLKIYWPAKSYDFTKQVMIPASKSDKSYQDSLLMINQELSKCNDIFVDARLRDMPMSMDFFLEQYHKFHLKKDFLVYLEYKIQSRRNLRGLEDQTYKNHTNTLNKLKTRFPRGLSFDAITVKFCRDFELYLKKNLGLKINTVWTHMKDLNTYLNLAKEEDSIPVVNPFQNGYSCSSKDSDVTAITLEELKALHGLLSNKATPDNEILVLRQFLFSCYTGLRISDIKGITQENIVGDELVFSPVKGRRFEKIQRVPLTDRAKVFIREDIEGRLFPEFWDQSCNRILKRIQKRAEIDTHLTNHVGRHSFATLFLELGGSVEVLQKLLGHSKIATTMKYVHVNQKRKAEQMSNFDTLDF